MFALIYQNNKPFLFLILGTNGSGKTTYYNFLKSSSFFYSNITFINPDILALNLANKKGYKNVNELPKDLKVLIDFQAAKQALQARINCFKQKISFIEESTASSRGTIKLIDYAKSQGYVVKVLFISLNSPKLNHQRIMSRVLLGGHFVEPSIVERRYKKALILLPEIFFKADRALLFDNSLFYRITLIKENLSFKSYPNKFWSAQKLDCLVKEIKNFSQNKI